MHGVRGKVFEITISWTKKRYGGLHIGLHGTAAFKNRQDALIAWRLRFCYICSPHHDCVAIAMSTHGLLV